MIKKVFEFIN